MGHPQLCFGQPTPLPLKQQGLAVALQVGVDEFLGKFFVQKFPVPFVVAFHATGLVDLTEQILLNADSTCA